MKNVAFVLLLLNLSFLNLNAQCIKGNCNNGKGTYVFKSGTKYIGQFKNGMMEGFGVCYFSSGKKYVGQWKKQLMHGKGVMHYKNGDKYKGFFKSNKRNGQGTLLLANGKSFDGRWLNDKPTGSLANEIESSEVSFVNSVTNSNSNSNFMRDCSKQYCASGTGYFYYVDGSKYIGEFVDGLPEGNGKCLYANGNVYEGAWKNHAPHGEGVMTFSSGKVYGAIWDFGKATKQIRKNEPISKIVNKVRPEYSEETKIWVVIVGIASYSHLKTLKYTDDDAYQLYAFLKSPKGGAVPEEQIRILIDESATKSNITRTMKEVFWKADENDVVLFYFSGHGLEGTFIPIDFDGYNNQLSHKEIGNIFEQSRAKHKVIFADACHSGSLVAMKSSYDQSLQNFYRQFQNTSGGMALMMSSKSEEVSLEFSGLRQGVFSHYLIRGLKGEADRNFNGIVTIDELFFFVSKGVKSYTGNIQTPLLTGDYDRNMPLAITR